MELEDKRNMTEEQAEQYEDGLFNESRDTAYEVHQTGLSRPRKPYWENVPILEDLPFVVIGNFAYLVGYDGSLWQAPYKKGIFYPEGPDNSRTSYSVDWREAVEIAENTPSAVFPLGRLKNVISDLQNITDIMHQHGVKTETDK